MPLTPTWLRVTLLASCSLVGTSCGNGGNGSGGTGGAAGAAGASSGTGGSSGHGGAAGKTGTGGASGAGGHASGGGVSPPIEPEDSAGDSVLRHHKNVNRDGVYIEPALTKAAVIGTATGADGGLPGLAKDPGFTAVLPDPNDFVYAQPMFVDGLGGQDMVIVATAANNVYALDANTGAQLWVQNVGAPATQADKPCGNLASYGITGTPVIDFPSRTLFFDAEVMPSGGGDAGVVDAGAALPKHEIFALSIDTGHVKSGWPVDVGAAANSGGVTFNSPFQGQRGALAIRAGAVYVPYGGLFGDCQPTPEVPYPDPDTTPYHGWIVSVSISDPTAIQSWATTANAGGIWAPGGISSDRLSLYVSTGNTQQTSVWGGGDAVLRFGAGAAFGPPADFFAPQNWHDLDNFDEEMGTAPVVFDLAGSTPGQLAITFGKDGNAYLLDRTDLGGVGSAIEEDAAVTHSPAATLQVATNEIISAPTVYTTNAATYVSFRANGAFCLATGGGDLTTLQIIAGTPPTLMGAWCAAAGAGAPMVTTSDGHADAIVWQMGAENDNHLHAFDGDTGAPLAFPGRTVSIPGMRRFNTPIAAKGRIYVAADGAVVAFKP
ncbi:MAG TPA: PQQ-binding-like beta-propeller repeat protein [Gemmatimonadaceae bacterium]|nr:PQQ-binding-like beta-propeller repeat protein [Gemmatimonadaceae bacterium]